MKNIKVLLALGIFLIFCSTSWADIPNLINFQGILDSSGNPLANRTVSVEFKIYAVPAGGTVFWSETQSVTTNAGGVFNVILGSSGNPIPDSAFDDTVRYLGIKVGSDAEMTPRQQIVSNAYGYRVSTVDGATGGVISGDVDIQSDLTVSGNVGIGTTGTPAQLTVNSGASASTLELQSTSAGGNVEVVFENKRPGGATADVGKLYSLNTADNFDGGQLRIAMLGGLGFYSDVATFTGTGNVGLGTTTPNEQLEITGNLRLAPSTATVGVIKSGANRFIHNFGTDNFFAGVNAGNLTTSGFGGNTGVGRNALQALTTGGSNTANGVNALAFNTTGSSNTANGVSALFSNTTGINNTANGVSALLSNTTGNDNTANGVAALYSNTTGINNTANGVNALAFNTTGNNNTANGVNALAFNTTGSSNTANGLQALYFNTTGINNTANGAAALYFNTTGSSNTANGWGALFSNTTGGDNTANGVNALYFNTTGFSNTANGANVLQNNTTGNFNTAMGQTALQSNTTGNYNTAVGSFALSSNTTGTNNTAIGYATNVSTGNLTNATAIGANAVVAASNALVLGGTGANAVNVGIGTNSPSHPLHMGSGAHCTAAGVWTNASSKQYKTDIEPLQNDEYSEILKKLEKLDVVRFKYKADPKREHIGLIAEDVPDEIASDDRTGIPTADAIGFLMAALKAQQNQIEIQQTQIKKLEETLNQLTKEE